MNETLIQSGIYAYVRHPEFLAHMLIITSLTLMAQHPISVVIGVVLLLLLCIEIVEEEKRNIEKFGDAYREYMRKVPRINLLAGIIKSARKKRSG